MTVTGPSVGLVRRRGRRCSRAEIFDLDLGERVSRASLGCRGRVRRIVVTAAGVLAAQVVTGRRTTIVEVDRSRRRVLDAHAGRGRLGPAFLGATSWPHGAHRWWVVLGRPACRRVKPTAAISSGSLSAWSEDRGRALETDVWDLVLACDSADGLVKVVDIANLGPLPCGGTYAAALRPPFVAISEELGSTHCSDDEFTLRTLDLRTSEPVGRSTLRMFAAPRRVQVTPTGNAVFTVPSSSAFPDGRLNVQVAYATTGPTAVLDAGPEIDASSLRLDGTTSSWTFAGQPRSAQTP